MRLLILMDVCFHLQFKAGGKANDTFSHSLTHTPEFRKSAPELTKNFVVVATRQTVHLVEQDNLMLTPKVAYIKELFHLQNVAEDGYLKGFDSENMKILPARSPDKRGELHPHGCQSGSYYL